MKTLLALLFIVACGDKEEPADCDSGCESEERFPCGGGSCLVGSEVCIIGGSDECSTCVPTPDDCASASCDCLPPANDPAYGELQCIDAGTCEDVEGGAVLSCDEIEWACG